jgi:hypothetical protein
MITGISTTFNTSQIKYNKKSKFLEGIINKKERTQSSVLFFPLNLESGHMTCGHRDKTDEVRALAKTSLTELTVKFILLFTVYCSSTVRRRYCHTVRHTYDVL